MGDVMLNSPVRSLDLAFALFGRPFVWRCSLCGRMFAPSALDLNDDQIGEIRRDFHVHLCWPVSNAIETVSNANETEDITEYDQHSNSWFGEGRLRRG